MDLDMAAQIGLYVGTGAAVAVGAVRGYLKQRDKTITDEQKEQKEQIQSLAREVGLWREQCFDLRKENGELKEELEEQRAMVKALQFENADQREEIKQGREERETQRQENAGLHQQIGALQEQIKTLRAGLAEVTP